MVARGSQPHRRLLAASLGLVVSLAISSCGSDSAGKIVASRSARLAHWSALAHVRGPVDVAASPNGNRVVVAADRRLWLLSAAGGLRPLGSGPTRYESPGGEEPYIALSRGGCFGAGNVYALRLVSGRGVVRIDRAGVAHRFARLSAPGLLDGIAFDQTGRFARRLLVTITAGSKTVVAALDCHGGVHTITRSAPRVEGGIAVAPSSFGRFAGDLIAPDETSGRIYAISPGGSSRLVTFSGLPHGGDVGVESEAFIPGSARFAALLADRRTPGNRHPGDDLVLKLGIGELQAAGARRGDLLIATEGGALAEVVSCGAQTCHARYVALGPAIAHAEGHIAFAAR